MLTLNDFFSYNAIELTISFNYINSEALPLDFNKFKATSKYPCIYNNVLYCEGNTNFPDGVVPNNS
jgi:hypothetical protein